ncbi:hypothetical protein OQH61_08815 [Helicobacter sp. MIT 21-1697]|uniref:hypothetical protein n=1 Tax=Helicobacter sp. MIT 21-1697 TaxID=2993733 RepID=UPI00224ADB06|nr:hypothetical protein [Helicobacter sp. MIT 21-1697]MCX2717832.1 hypothetical protein [Helicobacter sp. MIT 21-1697]
MLDAMQNAILNKPDSILEKRPNSPSAEVSKLENKFENILAKQQVKQSQAKEAQNKETQDAAKETKADSKGKNNADVKSGKLPAQSATTKNVKNAAVNKSANTPFDFKGKENVSEESKIGLQEKIAKSSKEVKPQDNPLLEALSAPLSAGAASSPKALGDKKEAKPENKNQNALTQKLPSSTPLSAQSAQKNATQAPKTLGDVESLAKSQGLNPSKITLQNADNPSTQTQELAQAQEFKPKSIPASAKESISYEYENNVDRIAIVQRGIKKPKNITSKISNEYPTKKSDDESGGGFFLKDRPQIG